MKKILSIVMFAFMAFVAQAQDADKTFFGDYKVDEAIARDASIIPQLLKDKTEVTDVTIKGTINGVCQTKGCWMTITLPNGEDMTVKFKDYAFFLPKDCAGKNIVAHGKTFLKITSVEELKHLAQDAGKSKKQIRKIKKPKQEYRFEADGVVLNG
jgi:hypothetical protein